MTGSKLAGGALATLLVLAALAVALWVFARSLDSGMGASAAPAAPHRGLLYGRVTTDGGTVYEGPMRFGGDQEALWGHGFNGAKDENPWTRFAPTERRSVGLFGIRIAGWDREMDGDRPFLARFGDIRRIERRGDEIRVTLKSGTEVVLDRMGSDDLGDGLRVWDADGGVVDLAENRIRTVELMPTPDGDGGAPPLHGTVRTAAGDFTGLVQWDRTASIGSDELVGLAGEVELRLPFDTIRAIERIPDGGSRVTLLDGNEIVLTGTRDVGVRNGGLYVDDRRYGRVLIPWSVFERVDFTPVGTGPGYGDFPPGEPLAGTVATRAGRRLSGRLVYDLDESETTETLDAPSGGVDYSIPFGLVAAIALPAPGESDATVVLQGGEALRLELRGDLGPGNGGLLVFTANADAPEYVPWVEVGSLQLDRPRAMYPPIGP